MIQYLQNIKFGGIQLLSQLRKKSFKGKLISVFALVSLIPIISLIIVSYIIIAQSIDKWEEASNELMKLRVLPMIDIAEGIASDHNLVVALENKSDLSKLDFALPEGYILAIYDTNGRMLFSSNNDPIITLQSIEELGFPNAKEFPKEGAILPREPIKIRGKEFALSAIMCKSYDNKNLGIAVTGKIMPSEPADISNVRRTIFVALGLSAILVFLISLWISSLIAREITEPIKKLVDGTKEISIGNLDYQVNVSVGDELGILSDSFNQMTVKLRNYADELKQAEKAAAWKEVAQKLAHEIKNPLTPIQLSAERIKRRYHSDLDGYQKVLDECVDTIVEEVERLRRLLDEFSQFARMPVINPIPSDINEVIGDAIRLYGDLPENIEIRRDNEELPRVSIDPDQMRRAAFNIIKNAIEAMSEGGVLTIATSTSDKNIQIDFMDTGPGISEDSMKNLFTPHFSMKKGGAGLGLAIVKKIVTDHGGDVVARNEEGKGAVFVIKIPFQAPTFCSKKLEVINSSVSRAETTGAQGGR